MLSGVAALLIACGPLGPIGAERPQSRLDTYPHTEIWRSPHPTPFGTAGLAGIPPRPSHSPAARSRAAPSAVPTATWTSRAEAVAAIAHFRPRLPADAQELVQMVALGYGGACGQIDRMVATAEVDALYEEVRRALIAADFTITYEDHRTRTGSFSHVLSARSSTLDAEVSAGAYVPSAWAAGTSVTRPHVVRVVFTHRCR